MPYASMNRYDMEFLHEKVLCNVSDIDKLSSSNNRGLFSFQKSLEKDNKIQKLRHCKD